MSVQHFFEEGTMEIRKGTLQDLEQVAALYDELNDYLESHTNYPGWKKGIYPIREDALAGIEEDNLFVAVENGQIAGTVILNHKPEEAYHSVDWHNELDYDQIVVIHTFAVHPLYLHRGLGNEILKFSLEYAAHTNMKAVRLDVYEKNVPAIHLYEKMGFEYIDTVDLGYGIHGLDWYKLYQRIL